jgi:hypothetical protein
VEGMKRYFLFFSILFFLINRAEGRERKFSIGGDVIYMIYLYNSVIDTTYHLSSGVAVEFTREIHKFLDAGITTSYMGMDYNFLHIGGVIKIRYLAGSILSSIKWETGVAGIYKGRSEYLPYIKFGLGFQYNYTNSIGIGIGIGNEIIFGTTILNPEWEREEVPLTFGLMINAGVKFMF